MKIFKKFTMLHYINVSEHRTENGHMNAVISFSFCTLTRSMQNSWTFEASLFRFFTQTRYKNEIFRGLTRVAEDCRVCTQPLKLTTIQIDCVWMNIFLRCDGKQCFQSSQKKGRIILFPMVVCIRSQTFLCIMMQSMASDPWIEARFCNSKMFQFNDRKTTAPQLFEKRGA